jgi:hypothetical protein
VEIKNVKYNVLIMAPTIMFPVLSYVSAVLRVENRNIGTANQKNITKKNPLSTTQTNDTIKTK